MDAVEVLQRPGFVWSWALDELDAEVDRVKMKKRGIVTALAF